MKGWLNTKYFFIQIKSEFQQEVIFFLPQSAESVKVFQKIGER